MILEEGRLVLIVYRRLFERDEARFFAGVVDGYEAGLVKVTGRSWMWDQFAGKLVKKLEHRTKIFSLASGTLIVYQLADQIVLDELNFVQTQDGGLHLTDGREFKINLTEKAHTRATGPLL